MNAIEFMYAGRKYRVTWDGRIERDEGGSNGWIESDDSRVRSFAFSRGYL
jgi:riboflavin biosynthesis pyrimidine reductase